MSEKRLIDANAFLLESIKEKRFFIFREDAMNNVFVVNTVYDDLKKALDNAPTIDAVEVVRCKDCKHWIVDSYWNGNPAQVRACRFAGWMCGANGYCLYGERKEVMEVTDP